LKIQMLPQAVDVGLAFQFNEKLDILKK